MGYERTQDYQVAAAEISGDCGSEPDSRMGTSPGLSGDPGAQGMVQTLNWVREEAATCLSLSHKTLRLRASFQTPS